MTAYTRHRRLKRPVAQARRDWLISAAVLLTSGFPKSGARSFQVSSTPSSVGHVSGLVVPASAQKHCHCRLWSYISSLNPPLSMSQSWFFLFSCYPTTNSFRHFIMKLESWKLFRTYYRRHSSSVWFQRLPPFPLLLLFSLSVLLLNRFTVSSYLHCLTRQFFFSSIVYFLGCFFSPVVRQAVCWHNVLEPPIERRQSGR